MGGRQEVQKISGEDIFFSFHLFVYFTLAVVVVLMTKMKSIRFGKFASCCDVFKTGG